MDANNLRHPVRPRGLARVMRRPAPGGAKPMPWLLAVPAILFALAVHVAPTFAGGWYAFTDWDGVNADASWVGFDNFRDIFDDPAIGGALGHTLFLAGMFLVVTNLIGLGLALGLNRGLKSRTVLRAIFFLPAVVSPLAVSFVWKFIFDVNGALNEALTSVGLDSWARPWLGEPDAVLWLVLVVMVWQWSGLTMIIYLAGLQSIPAELEEAAAVDGASLWMRFRRITLPLLAPAITVASTLLLILGLRVFDQVLALTDGGPIAASETLATQVYKQAFVAGAFGYSTALALILTVLIGVLSIGQLLILRAREAKING